MPDEPVSAVQEQKSSPDQSASRFRRLDWIVAGALILIVCLLFAKTVFAGAPISKVHIITAWDSVFSKFRTGQSQLMDPSLILLMVPYYLLVGRSWNHGDLPLWNPFSGFGGPLLADPQALAFSVLHFPLALSPTVETYNLILVMELGVLALGGFLLGKVMGLSRIPSAFLGLTLLLCPYQQWYLELLGNGYCLIPLLMAAFLNVARSKTLWSSVLAGVAASVFVLSAHPELSFCSIMIASIFMVLMIPLQSWRRSLVLLFVAGAMAFCLSSPMLLPFLEFLANSDSYKFGNRAPAYYPWQTLLFNLIQPGYGGASPFLGVLSLLTLPFGIATIIDGVRRKTAFDGWTTRLAVVIGALSVSSWVLSAKIYPLGILLAKKPLSYLVVTYAFPALIVLVAALAALGLERLLQISAASTSAGSEPASAGSEPASTGLEPASTGLEPASTGSEPTSASCPNPGSVGFQPASTPPTSRPANRSKELLLLCVGLFLIVLFPLLMRGANISMSLANFDMTLGAMTLNSRDWIRDIICAALISVLIIWPRLLKKRISPRVLTALACLCVFVGAFSQISISSKSMPTRPKFNYPETETMSLLKVMEGRRAIATGVHTMRPNTNLAYGFKDARFHNPIFPARYLAFMEKAGAKLDEFNQVFDDDPSGMIDLASISLIVTPGALVERKFFDSHLSDGVSNIMPPLPLKWTPTLTLSKLRYAVDPVEGAVFIEPTWQNSSTKSSKYAFNICIVNAAGEETWISDRLQIVESPSQVFTIGAPIRKALQNGKQLGIKISVFETASGALLEPLFQATGSKTGQALIKFQVPSPANIAKPDKTNASPVISSATTSGATAETSNAPISTSSGTVVSTPVSSSSPSTTFERRFKLLQESSDGIRIYENLSALPEAYVATNSIYIADKNAVLEKISSPDFDARNVVVLQGAGKDVLLPKGSFREPEARIMQRESTEILVRTTSSKPAFLVLTDTWYPGWSATVDGAPVSVLRANYSFRAVAIPAGMHNVQFRYIPVLFYVGLALFALAGQVVIAMSIVQWSIWRRSRRS